MNNYYMIRSVKASLDGHRLPLLPDYLLLLEHLSSLLVPPPLLLYPWKLLSSLTHLDLLLLVQVVEVILFVMTHSLVLHSRFIHVHILSQLILSLSF